MIRLLLFLTLLSNLLFAEIQNHLPPLTGRVVDNANILNIKTKQSLEKILKVQENNSSNQLVIATVTSLHGYSIEEFSIALARKWEIGQKEKDNGILLLIAPNERKIRIEVGYGLEGVLTDKISHEIIEYTILPYFKTGNFNMGVLNGANKLIDIVNGEYEPPKRDQNTKTLDLIPFLFIFFGFWSIVLSNILKNKTLRTFGLSSFLSTFSLPIIFSLFGTTSFLPYLIFIFIVIAVFIFIKNTKLINFTKNTNFDHMGGGRIGRDFGSSMGGFSGGGGSFGGGGASGGW